MGLRWGSTIRTWGPGADVMNTSTLPSVYSMSLQSRVSEGVFEHREQEAVCSILSLWQSLARSTAELSQPSDIGVHTIVL